MIERGRQTEFLESAFFSPARSLDRLLFAYVSFDELLRAGGAVVGFVPLLIRRLYVVVFHVAK